MQNKMPERFYAKHDMKNGWTAWALYPDRIEGTVEYVRADIVQPFVQALSEWETAHGTLAVIMPHEYAKFCEMIAELARNHKP